MSLDCLQPQYQADLKRSEWDTSAVELEKLPQHTLANMPRKTNLDITNECDR